MFYISNLNGYIRPCRRDVCVFVFEIFLIPPMQLQTTCSPRLLNGFWCFLVQNEEEILFVLLLFFPVHFCWVEKHENFERSKNFGFSPKLFCAIACFENRCHEGKSRKSEEIYKIGNKVFGIWKIYTRMSYPVNIKRIRALPSCVGVFQQVTLKT